MIAALCEIAVEVEHFEGEGDFQSAECRAATRESCELRWFNTRVAFFLDIFDFSLVVHA